MRQLIERLQRENPDVLVDISGHCCGGDSRLVADPDPSDPDAIANWKVILNSPEMGEAEVVA